MVKIDLHIHSTHSDGVLTPKELIDYAIKKNIPAIAIADHNKATANKEAEDYAKDKEIEYVPGIEITITPSEGVKELHIVGLFIDSENRDIKNIYLKNNEYVEKTTKKIFEKLHNLGYEITREELFKETNGEHLGRPFIAKILIRKYPEKFKERKQVFNELLGKNGKAFVKSQGTKMKEAIKIIHDAEGLAFVAHPWYLGKNMLEILEEFVQLGGDGIEMDYGPKDTIPKNTKDLLKNFVQKNNLLVSGGTDFHETKEEKDMGDFGITKEEFEKLKKKHKK